jgi:catechol 2,3-dioxygenase-like lactoylglutathione lyase family enzyme
VRHRPKFCGIDHVGVTVPDLDQATRFFCDVLGCVVVHTRGPTPVADPALSAQADKFVVDNLGVYPGTRVAGITMLRCGHGSNIELFDYTSPLRSERALNNADVGGHHLGFYTDDMPAAVALLKENGACVMGDIKTVTSGPEAGLQWIYFQAPWGLQMEMVSYPNGKAYESKNPELKLWSPKTPAL